MNKTKLKFIIIRVTEEERNTLLKRAKRAGKTMTRLIREYLKL